MGRDHGDPSALGAGFSYANTGYVLGGCSSVRAMPLAQAYREPFTSTTSGLMQYLESLEPVPPTAGPHQFFGDVDTFALIRR
jgi:hypothetical protein